MFSLRTIIGHLRLSALIEGISFLLLLFIAMPLKYFADWPLGVKVTGMAHGILFIWYIVAVFLARDAYKLSLSQTAVALIASLWPFGTFYADNKIFRHLDKQNAKR
jgi:integral membrane protein